MSKVNDFNPEQALKIILDKMTELANLNNVFESAKGIMDMTNFIRKIYDQGYSQGFNDAKEELKIDD